MNATERQRREDVRLTRPLSQERRNLKLQHASEDVGSAIANANLPDGAKVTLGVLGGIVMVLGAILAFIPTAIFGVLSIGFLWMLLTLVSGF